MNDGRNMRAAMVGGLRASEDHTTAVVTALDELGEEHTLDLLAIGGFYPCDMTDKMRALLQARGLAS